jgi:hypothetical protein
MYTTDQRQQIRQDAHFDQLVDSASISEGILALAVHKECGKWREINQEMARRYGASPRC